MNEGGKRECGELCTQSGIRRIERIPCIGWRADWVFFVHASLDKYQHFSSFDN